MPTSIPTQPSAQTLDESQAFSHRYLSNCHTHSHFCDGSASLSEMAAEAHRLGFVSLAFTGHSPLPYENDWAMQKEDLPLYWQEISRLREEYRGLMEILPGLEIDADTDPIPDLPSFAVLIGSLHTLHTKDGSFPVDASPNLLEDGIRRCYGGDTDALVRDYYRAAADFQKKASVQIVGHFDLLTKYNKGMRFFDETDPAYQKIALAALDEIAESCPDRLFELNTGVLLRAGKELPYPAPFLLRRLQQHGKRIVINSDAHRPEHLPGCHDTAARLLYEAGFRCVYRIRENGWESISL